MGVVQFLKHRGVFEGPGQFRRKPPLGVRGNVRLGPVEKTGVIGAMGEPGPGFRAGGECIEQGWLQEAAIMMAFFGQGSGKSTKMPAKRTCAGSAASVSAASALIKATLPIFCRDCLRTERAMRLVARSTPKQRVSGWACA
jgi:hypothetical protein